jgi:hypothetical protein
MIFASFGIFTARDPHWYQAIQCPSMPERRGIVAQVRRETLKKTGVEADSKFSTRCDDLLTSGVDNAAGAGL